MHFSEGVSLTSPVSHWKTQTQSICFMFLTCEGVPGELCEHHECGFKHLLSLVHLELSREAQMQLKGLDLGDLIGLR